MSSSFIRACPFSLICVASLAARTNPIQAKQLEPDLKVYVLLYNYTRSRIKPWPKLKSVPRRSSSMWVWKSSGYRTLSYSRDLPR